MRKRNYALILACVLNASLLLAGLVNPLNLIYGILMLFLTNNIRKEENP